MGGGHTILYYLYSICSGEKLSIQQKKIPIGQPMGTEQLPYPFWLFNPDAATATATTSITTATAGATRRSISKSNGFSLLSQILIGRADLNQGYGPEI